MGQEMCLLLCRILKCIRKLYFITAIKFSSIPIEPLPKEL